MHAGMAVTRVRIGSGAYTPARKQAEMRFGAFTPGTEYRKLVEETEKEIAANKKTCSFWGSGGSYDVAIFTLVRNSLDRIGLYRQQDWTTDPQAKALIEDTAKTIRKIPYRYGYQLREYARHPGIGCLPDSIADAVETQYEQSKMYAGSDMYYEKYTPLAASRKITPYSIETESTGVKKTAADKIEVPKQYKAGLAWLGMVESALKLTQLTKTVDENQQRRPAPQAPKTVWPQIAGLRKTMKGTTPDKAEVKQGLEQVWNDTRTVLLKGPARAVVAYLTTQLDHVRKLLDQ